MHADVPALVSIPLISGHQSGPANDHKRSYGVGLNPFDIRASVRTRLLRGLEPVGRLNPFDIRASVRTHAHRRYGFFCSVSIPLISGHQSGRGHAVRPRLQRGVSIPLISGHQSGPTRPKPLRPVKGLNPFDIRASVRTSTWTKCTASHSSLNPFDIRASVRTRSLGQLQPARVSIPLISGHQSGRGTHPTGCAICVSIPLISGHQSGLSVLRILAVRARLNPFDIRASVRTFEVLYITDDNKVSIPLISGHQSGRGSAPIPEGRF